MQRRVSVPDGGATAASGVRCGTLNEGYRPHVTLLRAVGARSPRPYVPPHTYPQV